MVLKTDRSAVPQRRIARTRAGSVEDPGRLLQACRGYLRLAPRVQIGSVLRRTVDPYGAVPQTLLELPGTPEEQKEHKVYPGGHGLCGLSTGRIQDDIVGSIDRHFGSAERELGSAARRSRWRGSGMRAMEARAPDATSGCRHRILPSMGGVRHG